MIPAKEIEKICDYYNLIPEERLSLMITYMLDNLDSDTVMIIALATIVSVAIIELINDTL